MLRSYGCPNTKASSFLGLFLFRARECHLPVVCRSWIDLFSVHLWIDLHVSLPRLVDMIDCIVGACEFKDTFSTGQGRDVVEQTFRCVGPYKNLKVGSHTLSGHTSASGNPQDFRDAGRALRLPEYLPVVVNGMKSFTCVCVRLGEYF